MVVVGKHFTCLWLSGKSNLTAKMYLFAPLPMSTTHFGGNQTEYMCSGQPTQGVNKLYPGVFSFI